MEDVFIKWFHDMTIGIQTSEIPDITHDYTELPKEPRSLNVLYVNIRSIKKAKKKIDELKCMLRMIPKSVHLILITETWLVEDDKGDTSLELENYILILGNRIKKTGGGVAAYIRQDIKYSYAEIIYRNGNNYLWVVLVEPKLNIGVVYYPGNKNPLDDFLADFEKQLNKLKDQRTVVLGDFNIDVLTVINSNKIKFSEILKEALFSILNKTTEKFFTRKEIKKKGETGDQGMNITTSVIDLVCSNLKTDDYYLALIDSSLSDHRQIYFEIRNTDLIPKDQEENWGNIVVETRMSNKVPSQLDDDMIEIVNKYRKDLMWDDWITNKICKLITDRNLRYQEYQTSPNEETKTLHMKAKEAVNEEMELKKREHKILTLIKNEFKKKMPSTIKKSIRITDSDKICDEFNNYFSEITGVGDLINDPNKHSDDATSSDQNNQPNQLSKISFCTDKKIKKIIDNLDPHANAGICGIQVASIQGLSEEEKNEICGALRRCFNKCFDVGFIPDCLKVSRVVPVHESSYKTDLENYSFVLALPIFSRILEKLLWESIQESSFAPIHYVTKNQYGYQEEPNTVSRMNKILSMINTSIIDNTTALGLFIDLKEALNKVSHSLLLKKLESSGVNGMALNIFKSYFANQKHVVTMGTFVKSKLLNIKRGVPQGSILGHLLFLIYIKGVTDLELKGDITVSAEKISLFYYKTDVFQEAQQDLDSLSEWFHKNGLGITSKNICYLLFTNEQVERPMTSSGQTGVNDGDDANEQELKYTEIIQAEQVGAGNDELKVMKIKQAKQVEFLGLTLDSGLKWTSHINKIITILKTFNENLKSTSLCPGAKDGLVFYNACVKPQICYLIGLDKPLGLEDETLKQLEKQLTELGNKLEVPKQVKELMETLYPYLNANMTPKKSGTPKQDSRKKVNNKPSERNLKTLKTERKGRRTSLFRCRQTREEPAPEGGFPENS